MTKRRSTVRSKLRLFILTGCVILAAFGGTTTGASADRICVRVDSTVGLPELERLGLGGATEPVCVRMP